MQEVDEENLEEIKEGDSETGSGAIGGPASVEQSGASGGGILLAPEEMKRHFETFSAAMANRRVIRSGNAASSAAAARPAPLSLSNRNKNGNETPGDGAAASSPTDEQLLQQALDSPDEDSKPLAPLYSEGRPRSFRIRSRPSL
jgi:hypothetical protein